MVVGNDIISKKQFSALICQGHDSSNGANGVVAIGYWSQITSNTAFVIGNGTAYNKRSNCFEVDTSGNVTAAGGLTVAGDVTANGAKLIAKLTKTVSGTTSANSNIALGLDSTYGILSVRNTAANHI